MPRTTKQLTRADAIAEIYRRLRAQTDALRASALLYAVGVSLDEIADAADLFGDKLYH